MGQLRDKLRDATNAAAHAAMEVGKLPSGPLPDADIQRPQNLDHGDYASNLAMKLARQARMNPIQIAELIISELPMVPEVSEANAAKPGFINFRLADSWLASQVEPVL